MKTRNKWLTAGLGLALGAVVVVWANMASIEAEAEGMGEIVAKPIPPGYNFPTDRGTIDAWVWNNNVTAMRTHGWDVWAGMAAPSGTTYRGQMLPVWETWYSDDEVFSGILPQVAAGRDRPPRSFISPTQRQHMREMALEPGPAEQVVAFNKFDGPSAAFIDAKNHVTPPSKYIPYNYTLKSSLTDLNNSWPSGTPVIDRKIDEFPNEAVDLKPVFWLIKQKGLTPLPFWQGAGQSSNKAHPTPETWFVCVLIDPQASGSDMREATPTEIAQAPANADSGLACKSYLYAPLTMLYNFQMDADEAAAFAKAQGGTKPQAGDYAALVAMHVTTKEIVNWTWQTFWWQAGTNPPDKFPGSVDGMSSKVKEPWRNYAMCIAYSMVVPAGDPTGKPVVCFNPYLETSPGIPDGLNSNCMSCHGTARFPANNATFYPPTYLPNGYIDFGSPKWFGTQTRMDFVWAITIKSR